MSKTTRMMLVMVATLAAFFFLPAVSFASTRTTTTANTTTTVSFAFTGLVKGTTTALSGGLTIGIRDTGYFNGNFHEPDGTQISVSGQVKKDGSLNITFYTKDGVPFIRGIAGAPKDGQYTGTFKLYQNGNSYDGIWSAIAVDPSQVLALAFTGTITSGPNTGLFLSGALVLNKDSLNGSFLEPDGTILPVAATLLSNNKYDIKVNFANGTIIGYGKATSNPANGIDKGFKGPFYGPGSNEGNWVAYFFNF